MRAFVFSGLIATFSVANRIQEAFAAAPPAAQAKPVEELTAECIRVKGTVQWAPVGVKSTDKQAWRPVRVGEEYGRGIQIRTGIRSSAVLRFGDDTVVQIGRSTLAAISEFHKSATTKRTRIGLDYGTVRAGVAEGELRSDFQIDTPVATLSKRGTWDFSIWVERGTGRFDVRGPDRGLLEILHKATGRIARIRPRQWINQAMLNWVETVRFDRQIVIADAFSQTAGELLAYVRNNTGRTGLQPAGALTGEDPLGPTGGTQGAAAADRAAALQSQSLTRSAAIGQIAFPDLVPEPTPSGDGDFGTGSPFGTTAQKRMTRRGLRWLRKARFRAPAR